jgi:hypothetical protein
VRGVVSAALGCRYVGVDIRSDQVTIVVRICALPLRMGAQVAVNQRQWRELLQGNLAWSSSPAPVWVCTVLGFDAVAPRLQLQVCSDAENYSSSAFGSFDLVVACPPYGATEVYSSQGEVSCCCRVSFVVVAAPNCARTVRWGSFPHCEQVP